MENLPLDLSDEPWSPRDERVEWDSDIVCWDSDKGIEISPGVRVRVYRWQKGIHEEGIVICRYGMYSMLGKYGDLVDVKFGDGKISKGHFTTYIDLA